MKKYHKWNLIRPKFRAQLQLLMARSRRRKKGDALLRRLCFLAREHNKDLRELMPHTVSISPWVKLPRASIRFCTEQSKFFQHKTSSQSERKQFRFILWDGEEMPLNLKEFTCRVFIVLRKFFIAFILREKRPILPEQLRVSNPGTKKRGIHRCECLQNVKVVFELKVCNNVSCSFFYAVTIMNISSLLCCKI